MAANVSLVCTTHQHWLNRYDFNLCLKTVRPIGPSNRKIDCSRGRAEKWRSFETQLFSFLFSAQGDHLAPSSEDGRGLEQFISLQESPRGMQERYHGNTCKRGDPA